jgi:diguanylate cyclase (GGDEF)-like protein
MLWVIAWELRMKAAAKIAVVYLTLSIVWVGGSDWIFSRLFPAQFPEISLYKGWIFVVITAILLYGLMRGEAGKRDRIESDLRSLAINDPLTGLLNRACFIENLERAIALADRNGSSVGVIFLDLDGFKAVNDRYGHHVGDELLIEVGNRLLELTRAADSAARFGGDEFVLLVHDDGDGVEALARRLVEAMRRSFVLRGDNVFVTASAGYALYPEHGRQGKQLLRAADMAMYRVKESGKNDVGVASFFGGRIWFEKCRLGFTIHQGIIATMLRGVLDAPSAGGGLRRNPTRAMIRSLRQTSLEISRSKVTIILWINLFRSGSHDAVICG